MSYASNLIRVAKEKHIRILTNYSNINGYDKLDCLCLTCGNNFRKIGYQIKGYQYPCAECSKRVKQLRVHLKCVEHFIERLRKEKPNYILVGEYKDLETPTDFMHLTCHHLLRGVYPGGLLRKPYTDNGCRYCGSNHHWEDDEIKSWLNTNTPSYVFKHSEMINHNNYVKLVHSCGKEFTVLWSSFCRQGTRCPRCNGGAKKDMNYFKQQVLDLGYSDYIVTDKLPYNDAKSPIIMHHKKCGLEYPVTPNGFLTGTRCPYCRESHGEKMIKHFLDDNFITYVAQKRFKTCIYKEVLPFDFYLPDYNLCIEYDGIQHFRPVSFFGGEDAFISQKLRDSVKDNWCQNNCINLLRIPYYITNQDLVNKYLNKYFNSVKNKI